MADIVEEVSTEDAARFRNRRERRFEAALARKGQKPIEAIAGADYTVINEASPMPIERLLTTSEVLEEVRLSRAQMYRMMAQEPPAFPLPIKLGKSKNAWWASRISKWLSERPLADLRRAA